ncbi:16S rRNA (uracil(1498)-N(3))-methyltransferase [Alphaproteobacteria bacterium]|nr:16S rRNA (uracil(1498)-N(3))-methyltransferase [Alphaproteobacteria bacterium]
MNNKLEGNLMHQLDYVQFIHLYRVVRLKKGDEIILFNNCDGEWLSVIEQINKKTIIVRCAQIISKPKTIPFIDLIFSPIKYQNSETIIRQGTEIGVRKFYPTVFNRTVVSKINMNKFNTYALGAAQQSGRTHIPEIESLKKLNLQKNLLKNKIILMFDENLEGQNIQEINVKNNSQISVIIGPEGGFSDKERTIISSFSNNFYNLKIGQRILKADTAVICALSLVFHYFDRD